MRRLYEMVLKAILENIHTEGWYGVDIDHYGEINVRHEDSTEFYTIADFAKHLHSLDRKNEELR